MKKYVMEIGFDDKTDLIILLVGNLQDMHHYLEKFKISNKFNINEFIGWIKYRDIFFYAYSLNKRNLQADFEAFIVNRKAKKINKYYSKEIMKKDIKENNLIAYDWKSRL